jgi:hypothetical protein
MVVPFFLHFVWMTIPRDVAVAGTKDPGTLVADFITGPVVPGIQKWIGCRLYLLVRSHVDRAIGIEVMVRTSGNTTGREIGAGIGHGGVDRIAAERTMIGTEGRETARIAITDVLPFGREDKEDIVDA